MPKITHLPLDSRIDGLCDERKYDWYEFTPAETGYYELRPTAISRGGYQILPLTIHEHLRFSLYGPNDLYRGDAMANQIYLNLSSSDISLCYESLFLNSGLTYYIRVNSEGFSLWP